MYRLQLVAGRRGPSSRRQARESNNLEVCMCRRKEIKETGADQVGDYEVHRLLPLPASEPLGGD